jgi:large subunit ribosomal protein L1
MAHHSKRYEEAAKKVDRVRRYDIDEAVALLKEFPVAKFKETVEVAMNLGIDTKQSDQQVRGSVSLPNGIGKNVRVIAFCEGALAEEAIAAGAIEAGGEELTKKIQGGWMDFDVAIADPKMMRYVGQLGRVLGPQGKMPSPKSGTVTPDVVSAVKEFGAGRIEFRADSTGNIHAPVGQMDFDADKLAENMRAFVAHIESVRPPAVKGHYINTVTVSSTMGPGIRVAI